ncbi:hypothetical protein VPH35_065959 [Triticum aestivum]
MNVASSSSPPGAFFCFDPAPSSAPNKVCIAARLHPRGRRRRCLPGSSAMYAHPRPILQRRRPSSSFTASTAAVLLAHVKFLFILLPSPCRLAVVPRPRPHQQAPRLPPCRPGTALARLHARFGSGEELPSAPSQAGPRRRSSIASLTFGLAGSAAPAWTLPLARNRRLQVSSRSGPLLSLFLCRTSKLEPRRQVQPARSPASGPRHRTLPPHVDRPACRGPAPDRNMAQICQLPVGPM